jgi:hypothetical protein
MLIRGDKLTAAQRAEVLRTYVHRWTHENAKQTYGGKCPGCEQSTCNHGHIVTGTKVWTRDEWHAYHVPLVTDEQWLKEHAFHFIKDGSRLSGAGHAEPAFMAD